MATVKVKVNIKARKMLPKYSDADLTVLAERIGLTLDQLKKLQEHAHHVYQYIGADLAECVGGAISRYEVVETALDASRILTICRDVTPELKKWLEDGISKQDLDDVYAAVAAAFPFPRYE